MKSTYRLRAAVSPPLVMLIFVARLVGTLVLLPNFVCPALIDGCVHDSHVVLSNAPNKEHLDVMLDCDKFRVVHSRFHGELLSLDVDLQPDSSEAEAGLVLQQLRSPRDGVYNPMLVGFHSFLSTCSALICQYGPSRVS